MWFALLASGYTGKQEWNFYDRFFCDVSYNAVNDFSEVN